MLCKGDLDTADFFFIFWKFVGIISMQCFHLSHTRAVKQFCETILNNPFRLWLETIGAHWVQRLLASTMALMFVDKWVYCGLEYYLVDVWKYWARQSVATQIILAEYKQLYGATTQRTWRILIRLVFIAL